MSYQPKRIRATHLGCVLLGAVLVYGGWPWLFSAVWTVGYQAGKLIFASGVVLVFYGFRGLFRKSDDDL